MVYFKQKTLNNYDLNQVADQLFSLKQWQALMKGIILIARIAHSRLMSAKLLDSEHVQGVKKLSFEALSPLLM